MNQNISILSELIFKYLRGELTVEESLILQKWKEESRDNAELFESLINRQRIEEGLSAFNEASESKSRVRQKLENSLFQKPKPHIFKTTWFRYAASIIILLGIGSYLWNKSSKIETQVSKIVQTDTVTKDILPGGNRAILTLSDGRKIELTENTINISESGMNIQNTDGRLTYGKAKQIVFNTMSVPRGGQYQVVLPDGTAVWLNSGSSLRYPTLFNGSERIVEISGEAYFEVAKDSRKPFKVKINLPGGEWEEVEVLGTHFNINAYYDEPVIKTTLFEGSVKVNRSGRSSYIKPGQQSQSSPSDQIKIVDNANLEEVIAWKEGRFQFENADIHYVMRQLARWYDIEVSYSQNISKHFDGTIPRDSNLLNVLNMLELTGEVNFKVEGKKVLVIPR